MTDTPDEVGRLMDIIQGDLRNHEGRIAVLERNDVKQDERIAHQQRTLEKIESNTTWILRLVIGAIVIALLGLIIVKTPASTARSSEVVAYVA